MGKTAEKIGRSFVASDGLRQTLTLPPRCSAVRVLKCKTGSLAAPRFVRLLSRGSVDGAAVGSHRKSGVRNGVKNLCPVESFSLRAIAPTRPLIRRCNEGRKQKIIEIGPHIEAPGEQFGAVPLRMTVRLPE